MTTLANKRLTWGVVFLLLILTLAACGPGATPAVAPAAATPIPATEVPPTPTATVPPPTEAPPPAVESELVLGLGNVPGTGDPHKFLAPPSAWLNYLVFDSLLENDDNYQVQPALAESYENIDATTWEVKLRPGVKFHNGDELTAADVKFSFDRVLNPDNNLSQGRRVLTITGVEVVDDLTVRITTEEPDPLFLQRIASQFIIPQKYFEEQGEEGFGKAPIGTGPYQVVEMTPDSQVVLEAFPDSWRGAPNIDRLVWKVMREPATRVAALRTGEIDIAQAVPPDQAADLEAEGIQVLPVPRAQVQTVAFESDLEDSPLADAQVRQALNYAVDKEALIDSLLYGFSGVADGQLVGPDGFGYNQDVEAYPYDPEMARQLLAEAGYPDGFSVAMEATVGNFPNDKQIYEAVAAYLEDVGVDVDLQFIELSVWLEKFYGGDRAPLWVQGLQYLPFMDADLALGWYSCSQPEGVLRFCNEAFEEKLQASRSEMDPEKRRELLQEAIAIFHDEAPALFLYQLSDLWGLSPNVSGLAPRSDAVLTLERVTKNP